MNGACLCPQGGSSQGHIEPAYMLYVPSVSVVAVPHNGVALSLAEI